MSNFLQSDSQSIGLSKQQAESVSVNRPPFLTGDDARATLYNQAIQYGTFIKSTTGQLYFDYHNQIGELVDFDSQEMIDLLHDICNTELGAAYSTPVVKSIRDSLRPNFKRYAVEKVVMTRIAYCDNTFLYALSPDNILSIKDGKLMKYKGNAVILKGNQNYINQVQPNFRSPAEALPGLLDRAFGLSEENKLRFYAHLVGFFLPHVFVPMMLLTGGHGTAKTTTARKIVELVDPRPTKSVAVPDKEDNLAAMLSNNYILPLDNVSKFSKRFADLLCIACTGGSYSKRQLYSDNTLLDIQIKSHIILTGIGNPIAQADLAERTDVICLDPIEKRLTEHQVWAEFNQLKPDILGSIFNVLCQAIPMVDTLEKELTDLPRAADYCVYGAAFIKAMGLDEQQFLREYQAASKSFIGECACDDPLSGLVFDFMTLHRNWKGTAAQLLDALKQFARQHHRDMHSYTTSTLSRALGDRMSDFANLGIQVSIKKTNPKSIVLTYTGGDAE